MIADHPGTDPGDGRTQCPTCGKYIWLVTHSCKGIRVYPPGDPADPVSRVQAIEAAEDHADQVIFDAWRERGQ